MNSSLAAELVLLRLALDDSKAFRDLDSAESSLNEEPAAKEAYREVVRIEERLNLNPNDPSVVSELWKAKKKLDELPSARSYMTAYLAYCALIDKINALLFFGEGLLMRYKGC